MECHKAFDHRENGSSRFKDTNPAYGLALAAAVSGLLLQYMS